MNPIEESIKALRAALDVSPDNVPLKIHLAQTLNSVGRFAEAEEELRSALATDPNSEEIKLALVETYLGENRLNQAAVIIEDLAGHTNPSAKVHVAYARLLYREGKIADSVAQYKLALEKDPDSADDELGGWLGVSAEDEDGGGEVYEGRIRNPAYESGDDFSAEIERPELRFADVGGMDEVKEEINLKILYPMKNPEIYEAYGKQIGGGILLYGPPGCGKTYLARATAGEMGAGFISVGISDVLDMWTGQSERNLTTLFEQARLNKPCVLFFDEVDALGGRRSDMNSGSGRQLINQFLAEMDGVEKDNEGILVLAATNAPWHVDPAFRRPGRFDRVLFVPPPDQTARASILRIHLRGKPQASIDYTTLAQKNRQILWRRPQGSHRSGDRIEIARSVKNRNPPANCHQRPDGSMQKDQTNDPRMVLNRPQLRTLLEPGWSLRRRTQISEHVGPATNES